MTENENDPIDALPDDVFDDLMHSLATSPSGSNRPGGNMAWVHGVRIDPEQLMRPRMACELLGIAKSTLYKWVKSGKLPKPIRISHKVSGWPRHVLLDWRDRQEGGALAPRGKLATA